MNFRSAFICRDCLLGLRRLPGGRQQKRTASTDSYTSALRLGVIGSGPAGFYAAARVLQKLDNARVDMYEKLPVPFGLVRYGVAPDHPEVKNCQDRFEEVASSNRFQFIGNITVGDNIRLSQMKHHYDALLFAYGASKDRLLGVPGEQDLKGIYSAREFVGWYNGLPEFAHLTPNLEAEHAVIIGNGNVALDVARILLTSVDSLRKTDITDSALDALSKSRVKRLTIAGRRGPMQAAFTIKELRELVNLPATAFHADNPELIPSAEWIAKLPRLEQRRYRFAKLLTSGAVEGDKHCHLRSLISPDTFLGNCNDGALSRVLFRHNVFRDDAQRFQSNAQVKPTEHTESLEAGLAFRSIGYKAVSIPGLREELNVDFSERTGIITNDGLGRALQPPMTNSVDGSKPQQGSDFASGCYCTGWVKNGPTGVIATTMEDAFATADSIIKDWKSSRPFLNGEASNRSLDQARGWDALREEPSMGGAISWDDWRAIDNFEKQMGQEKGGKPRWKLGSVQDMVDTAMNSRA